MNATVPSTQKSLSLGKQRSEVFKEFLKQAKPAKVKDGVILVDRNNPSDVDWLEGRKP